jgi:hypothetical protein
MTPSAAATRGVCLLVEERGSGDGVWVGCGQCIAGDGRWRAAVWSLVDVLEERRIGERRIGERRRELEVPAPVIVVVVDDGYQNRSRPAGLGQIEADAPVSPSCISWMQCPAVMGFSVHVLGVAFPLLPPGFGVVLSHFHVMLIALLSIGIGLASYAVMPAVKMPALV